MGSMARAETRSISWSMPASFLRALSRQKRLRPAGTVLAGDDSAVRQLDGGSGCAAGALGHGVSLLFYGTVADSQTG